MIRREVIAIIGAGAVGTALGLSAQGKGHRLAAVVSRRLTSARKLGRIAHVRRVGTDVAILPPDVTMIVIAVPDHEISSVVARLASMPRPTRKRIKIFHTSGLATSDLLRPLRRAHAAVCSIHPIRSFPPVTRRSHILRTLEGEWFGIEGAQQDQRWAKVFVRSLGGKALIVPKSKKTQYHIACTFASNYPLAILRATEIFANGALRTKGLVPLRSLLFGTLLNGLQSGPMKALTGPVARGDDGTIRKHRSEIRKTAPHLIPLFDELVLFTSREAAHAGRISPQQGRSVRRAMKR